MGPARHRPLPPRRGSRPPRGRSQPSSIIPGSASSSPLGSRHWPAPATAIRASPKRSGRERGGRRRGTRPPPRTGLPLPQGGRRRPRAPRSPGEGRSAQAAAEARPSAGPTRSWWWNARRCSHAKGPSPSGMSSSAWKASTRWPGSPGSIGRRRSTSSASTSRSSHAALLHRSALRWRAPRPSTIRSLSGSSSPPTPRHSSF